MSTNRIKRPARFLAILLSGFACAAMVSGCATTGADPDLALAEPPIQRNDPLLSASQESSMVIEELRKSLFELGRAVRDMKLRLDGMTPYLPPEALGDASALNGDIVRAASWIKVMKTQSDTLRASQQTQAEQLIARLEAMEAALIESAREAQAAVESLDPAPAAPEPADTAVADAELEDLSDSLSAQVMDDADQAKLVELIVEGEDLVSRRKYGPARRKFDAALALDPQSVRAGLGLATCLVAQGRYDDARTTLDGMTAEPDNPHRYGLLGLVDFHQGRLAFAEEHLRRAIELGAQDAQWHNYLGIVLFQQGDRDGAMAALRESLQLDPANLDVLYNMIMITASGENPDLGEAGRLYDLYLMRGGEAQAALDAMLRP